MLCITIRNLREKNGLFGRLFSKRGKDAVEWYKEAMKVYCGFRGADAKGQTNETASTHSSVQVLKKAANSVLFLFVV